MKEIARGIVAALLGLVLACPVANAQQTSSQTTKQVKKDLSRSKPTGTASQVRAPFKPKIAGIDPAVVALRVDVKRQVSPSTADIEIVGVVQNIGSEDFLSTANQQSVQLYQKTPGAADRMLLKKEFLNLKSGQKVEVRHRLQWSTSVEFPANYLVMISYDPDITLDGNPNNDDVKRADNRRQLRGDEITQTVRKWLEKARTKTASKVR